jgi:hypothetical protein
MKYNELDDFMKLATKEWVEGELRRELASFKLDLRMARVDRMDKLFRWAGLVAFGFIWGFVIAEFLFLHK